MDWTLLDNGPPLINDSETRGGRDVRTLNWTICGNPTADKIGNVIARETQKPNRKISSDAVRNI